MPRPPLPTTPDLSDSVNKGGKIVENKNTGARVWWEMYLQETYTEEWSVDTNPDTRGPLNFTGNGPTPEGQEEPLPLGRYCRDIKDVQKWRQSMGLYYYHSYTVEEEWSGWEIFGAVVLVTGLVVLGVATGGAAFGAAGGWFVATAGGATALTTGLLATGAATAGVGALIIKEAGADESRGKRLQGQEGYTSLPTGDADNYDTEEVVVRDWYTC